MPNQCEQIKQEYGDLKILKQEFDLEYKKPAVTRDLAKTKELKAELEQKIDALQNKVWPFEALPRKELKEQYESQKNILERLGILKKLSNGAEGIQGIDNKEYGLPSYAEISQSLRQGKEWLKTKTEQGFNRLLIVPLGLSLDDLIEKYRQVILRHHQAGKLLATKANPTDPDEPLALDESQPVRVWEKYKNADSDGKLVYFPKEFSEKHQGKTKKEVLKKQGGWTVLLLENLPNLPRRGQGKEIKGRKQLEADQTPNQYLETLKTGASYENETGMTPEEQIIYAIKHLEQTNQVIDDYQGKGSASFQMGAYFPADGAVPIVYCYRDLRRASLYRNFPDDSDSGFGVRGAVRVEILKFKP